MSDMCLHFTGLKSFVNNARSVLHTHFSPFLPLTHLWSPFFNHLSHTCLSPLRRLICSPFFRDLCGLKMCTSVLCHLHEFLCLPVSLSCLLSAIKPRRRAGTIQRWQNCTKHWVSKETINAPSESCSLARDPHWAAAARHHHTSALKTLSHSSLRALCFKHLRDYIPTVINLRGPVCQQCDCLVLSL